MLTTFPPNKLGKIEKKYIDQFYEKRDGLNVVDHHADDKHFK